FNFHHLAEITVQRMNDLVKEGDREFKAEVSAIGSTNYRNLVQLLGYYNEGQHRLLVYELMSNDSLASFLFEARISYFGLAKLLKTDQTHTTTGIRGTKGYVAPEWFRNMPVTIKVDVYSFDILLLELICCRKSLEAEAKDKDQMILAD
ncbi:hypothetical protein CMV_026312, partial [Castanea mollissima]